jgi:predicted aspartyl protease
LFKNGKFDENDILGVSYASIADGSIVENGLINIKRIEIGGEDGIVLENIQASVALNQDAPILLGNSVLDELASVEVDNISKTINFNKK